MSPLRLLVIPLALAMSCAPVFANEPSEAANANTNPQVDYDGFVELTHSLTNVRQERLLGWDEFARRMKEEGALLLDARSAEAFAGGHIAGAVNVPLPDFTDGKLAETIGPDRDRPIYIYCNNNFSDNIAPVPTKRAPLALNIATFINLHGYGYTNVWELRDMVSIADVPWETGETLALAQ